MKLKSVAMLVLAGAITTSLAYVAPVMADDDFTTDNGMMNIAASDGMPTQDNDTKGSSQNAVNNNDNDNNDAGGPDTATGDDDY